MHKNVIVISIEIIITFCHVHNKNPDSVSSDSEKKYLGTSQNIFKCAL